jgi:hypothetical protein
MQGIHLKRVQGVVPRSSRKRQNPARSNAFSTGPALNKETGFQPCLPPFLSNSKTAAVHKLSLRHAEKTDHRDSRAPLLPVMALFGPKSYIHARVQLAGTEHAEAFFQYHTAIYPSRALS